MRKLSILCLLALAACGTPQERCINRSTGEVRDLMRLQAEVEGNLARGYAVEEYDVAVPSWEVCGYDRYQSKDGRIISRPRMCMQDDYVTRTRRVAIDPEAEMRKRDALRARIKVLTPQAEANVAACRAAYPES